VAALASSQLHDLVASGRLSLGSRDGKIPGQAIAIIEVLEFRLWAFSRQSAGTAVTSRLEPLFT